MRMLKYIIYSLIFSVFCFSNESIILLIRHGQTDWNIDDRIQGHTNNPLNKKGIIQAKNLANKIEAHHPDIKAIYSSDLDRAFLTAQITAKRLHLSVEKRPQLRERNNGSAEGLSSQEECILYGESEKILDQLYPSYQERWCHTSIPGAETYDNLLQRIKDELSKIAKEHPNEKVAIFAHGEILGIFISSLLHKEKPIHLPNCGIAKIIFHPDDSVHPFKFISIDDSSQ